MALSHTQTHAANGLAEILMTFLPASGRAEWKGHVTFGSVAEGIGVGDLWTGGSKRPAVVALLSRTLEYRPSRFEPLVNALFREGLTYRSKGGNPVTADELDRINAHILALGFKFPDLWDPALRKSLAGTSLTEAALEVSAGVESSIRGSDASHRVTALAGLQAQLYALHQNQNPNEAGLLFEHLLNQLFTLFRLSPRSSFRVTGEQIDGSFELDNATYLVEAKWHKHPISAADLYVFLAKVIAKSAFTRGLFISLNGFTNDALQAITQGKQPCFFLMDGYELNMLLSGQMDLIQFLRLRRRLLEEQGRVAVPFPTLVSMLEGMGS